MLNLCLLLCSFAPLTESMSADERYAEISALFERSPVRALSSDEFHRLVEPASKNYAVAVLFTTTHPEHVCPMCRTAIDALTKVAKSYEPNDLLRVFFAYIDFKHTQDVFRELGLNAVPVLYFYGANRQARDVRRVYFEGESPVADMIVKVVLQETKQKIRVIDSENQKVILAAGLCTVAVAICLYYASEKLRLLRDTLLWSTIGLMQVTFFISGFMWNQIRGPQFSVRHAKTLIDRLVSTAQNHQYGAESIFVSGIYLTIAAGLLLLDKAGRSTKGYPSWFQKALKVCGVVLFLFGLNLMMYLFVRKSPFYPYTLFR